MTRAASIALIAFTLAGCDQSQSDMGAQRKAKAYSASAVFADGATIRPAVPGTVPRVGGHIAGGEEWLSITATMPMSITAELIDRGQTVFEVNCAACHGRLGNGNGMIVQRGFAPAPSFHVDRLKQASDAHLFNVITHGYGAMYPYGDRISPDDRWAVVAYIRTLQAAPDLAGGEFSSQDHANLLIGGDRNGANRGAQ